MLKARLTLNVTLIGGLNWQSLKLNTIQRLNTNLIETNLQRETNCYYALKPIDQVLIALQFYASGGLLQVHLVVGDTTGGGKSTVSRAVHNTDAMLKTITVLIHGKLYYGIPTVD